MSALAFLNCYLQISWYRHLIWVGELEKTTLLLFLPFSIHDYYKIFKSNFSYMPGRVCFKNIFHFPFPLSPQRDQVVLERWYNSGWRPDISCLNAHRKYQISQHVHILYPETVSKF